MASESIRSRGIFCDTSFFFAALVSSDPNHQRAKTALLEHTETVLATTWDIVSETLTLLRYRGNYRLALAFLTQVKPHLDILSYDPSIREEAEMVFKRFSKDKRLSFCESILRSQK